MFFFCTTLLLAIKEIFEAQSGWLDTERASVRRNSARKVHFCLSLNEKRMLHYKLLKAQEWIIKDSELIYSFEP